MNRWALQRARGRWHYILTTGVIGYGVPMFVVMTFVVNRPAHLTPGLVAVMAAMWAVGGLAFGACVWYFSERRYKRLASSKSAEVTSGVA